MFVDEEHARNVGFVEGIAHTVHGAPERDEGTTDAVHRTPWSEHLTELHRSWRPGQHVSVLGQNGSGKSHLMRWLLELWKDSRVLLLDTKASDDLWRDGPFLTVHEFPSWWRQKGAKSGSEGREWYRLVPQGGRSERRQAVAHGLRAAFKAGDWLVAVDETRSVAASAPGLDLDEELHDLWQRGRAKRVTVLAGAQSPVNLPSGFYDESRRLYCGFIADARRLKRVGEIAADADRLLEAMQSMDEFEFAHVERRHRAPVEIVKAPKRLPRPL